MSEGSVALREAQSLLGHDLLSNDVWRDIRLFVITVLDVADSVWGLQQLSQANLQRLTYQRDDHERREHERRCVSSAAQLCAALGVERAACGAAAILLYPQYWQPTYNGLPHWYYRQQSLASIVESVAHHCITQYQPNDWPQRIARRMYDLCTVPQLRNANDFVRCIDYLLGYGGSKRNQHVAALLDVLTIGEWASVWQSVCVLADRPLERGHDYLARSWERVLPPGLGEETRQPSPGECIRDYWQAQGASYIVWLLARFDARSHANQTVVQRLWSLVTTGEGVDQFPPQLNMSLFRRVLEAVPESLTTINSFVSNPSDILKTAAGKSPWSAHLADDNFHARLRTLLETVLWELLSDFRAETWPVLVRVNTLSGGRYLLRLAEEVQQRGLTKLGPSRGYWHNSTNATAVLACLLSRLQRRDDNSALLVPLLQQLTVPTLLAILPLVPPFEADICAALGWEGSFALVALLRQIERSDPAHSTDPSAGIVQRQAVLEVVDQLGEEHARLLLDAFASHCSSAVLLVQAVFGWNRTEVRRMFGRRKPLAVRALALLPFEKNDSLLKRYQTLANFEREANNSPASRKAAERAAAQSGLSILALQAGYADTTRLEWAMQDQLGSQGVSLGRQWEIEGYTLTMMLRETTPLIEVRNGKRVLKRTPAAVTRDYAYREVRATFEQLNDQHRRYVHAFMNAMRRGEPLSIDELALLRRNPLATALLERLVLRTTDGAFGLYRAEDNSLEGYHEERVKIEGAVYIAHPYDLAQANLLGDWQAEIIRRQIVQPFKQVFRELYVLTPAEVEAAYSSSRLAGRRLKGRQATAVLANMGWHVGGYSTVTKLFYNLGFAAHFESGAYWYDDDEGNRATTGMLTFQPLPNKEKLFVRRDPHDRRIHLAEIPPLVLSEVMRDLDLVTVVAHGSDDEGASREVLQRRGDLVRATVTALGLRNVEVGEPYVRVHGSRASYRIHLATAAIHIEAGSYLCIVPAANLRKATFLPFEEGGDVVCSELISKVLLLANDSKISDPTILAQIEPLRRAA